MPTFAFLGLLVLLLAGCGDSNKCGTSDCVGKVTGGATAAGGTSSTGGSATNGGTSNTGGRSATGGSVPMGGSSTATGGSSTATGGSSTATGGAGGAGGEAQELVDCDVRKVVCRIAVPSCPENHVPSVIGTCYGPCTRIESCACTVATDCPDNDQYTCWRRMHCGPYVD